jgi:hypothetical protein
MDNRVLLSRQFTVVKWGAGTQFCKFTKLQKYRNSLSLSKILQSHPNDKKEKKIVKLYQQVFFKFPIEVKCCWDFVKKNLLVSQILSHEKEP